MMQHLQQVAEHMRDMHAAVDQLRVVMVILVAAVVSWIFYDVCKRR